MWILFLFYFFQTLLAQEDKEIMTDPVELEMEESELKDPVKDPEHDPLKELDLDQSEKPEKDPATAAESEPDAKVKPEARGLGQGQDRVPIMSPSEEERSATRTLIRQPEHPETRDGEDEHEQVQYL